MKVIISILVALIFTLFGLMKMEGYYDFGEVDFLNIDGLFKVDFSFVRSLADFILYIPELIFHGEKESIQNFFYDYSTVSDNDIYILIIFLFHFFGTLLIYFVISYVQLYYDKRFVVWGILLLYVMFIYLMKTIA